jgi:alanine racemase
MSSRRAIARVNVAAIERNCARLRAELRGGCELCVVVKADGYGHGAVASARAALRGGAERLAVAGSQEALALRQAGLGDTPLLVMGALSELELREALSADADVVVWREEHVGAVSACGGGRVHVKLDTGMGRLGTRDPEEAWRVVQAALQAPGVELAGAMTHFATADDRDDPFFERQLELFGAWAREVKAAHPRVLVHAANSAAALREPGAHFDMARCGIAVYGMDPFGEDPLARDLEPALELVSYVAEVKRCMPGESAGYGRRFVAELPTWLAVLPIGYGDGWRRGLSGNAEVLIGDTRRPLVGTVSMDNLTVNLGAGSADPDPGAGDRSASVGGWGDGGVEGLRGAEGRGEDVEGLRGAEAVLIGARGSRRITAEELAGRLGTINYEVTCGLTARVPRVYHRDGDPLGDEGQDAVHPAAAGGT